MDFEVVGDITGDLGESFSLAPTAKTISFAQATTLRLATGEIVRAELHRYEATGIGKREMKIKAFL